MEPSLIETIALHQGLDAGAEPFELLCADVSQPGAQGHRRENIVAS
jgi:hypothetical protein